MIKFEKKILKNGLTVIVQEDDSTPLAAVNILYNVGARDEQPNKTGFAHLFEHFMFEGSINIPDFDTELQNAGGENNAFTSSDITNYYDILPASNLETAFWLESDRMLSLDFNEESLDTQKKVVIEEFKEHYINQPYGDWWHKMSELAYKIHPYRWPVIGMEISHIENVKMEEFKQFFYKYYRPNNAILVVCGGVKSDTVFSLAEKWFGDIPAGEIINRNIASELVQTEKRTLTMSGDVPVNCLFKAWKMCNRLHDDYPTVDLLRDLLSNGESCRMYNELVKEKKIFSSVNAYLSDTADEGLFFVEARLNENISFEEAEIALNECVLKTATQSIDNQELQKVKNKLEAYVIFGDTHISNRAMNLAFYEWLGDANRINTELERYKKVSISDIQRIATDLFKEEKANVIYYKCRA